MPLYGSGDKYGQSVSIRYLSFGTYLATSLRFFAFLNVKCSYNANVDSLNLVINHQGHMIDILNERLTGANNLNSAVSAEREKTNEANNRASEANRRAEQLRKQNEQLKKITDNH